MHHKLPYSLSLTCALRPRPQDSLIPAAEAGPPGRLSVHLYQTPKLRGALKRLPPRWNEIVGVSHVKAIVADDDVVMTGANLSETYFTLRQDRCMRFRRTPGLADEVAGFVDALGACASSPRGSAAVAVAVAYAASPRRSGISLTERSPPPAASPQRAVLTSWWRGGTLFSQKPRLTRNSAKTRGALSADHCHSQAQLEGHLQRAARSAASSPRSRPSAFRAQFASSVGSLFLPHGSAGGSGAAGAASDDSARGENQEASPSGSRFSYPDDIALVMPAVQAGSLGVHQVPSRPRLAQSESASAPVSYEERAQWRCAAPSARTG